MIQKIDSREDMFKLISLERTKGTANVSCIVDFSLAFFTSDVLLLYWNSINSKDQSQSFIIETIRFLLNTPVVVIEVLLFFF
jgi:hypothetical protein